MTDVLEQEQAETRLAEVREAARRAGVERHLERTGGRLACCHPAHRMAVVPNSPARVILPECAGQEAWLQARLGGIGGSEVGALVGISDYDTSFSVWNTKKHGGKDLSALAAIEWGHRLEEVVAQKVADNIGMASRFAGGLWADRERDFLRVTPDRFATKPRQWTARALIECKTAGDDEHWESGTISPKSTNTGSAPLTYQAQAQWQMGVIGLPVCYLGCLVLGRERQFFTVEIEFDKDWFGELADEAERFWVQNVLGDEPPMHNFSHPKTEELLKTLSPHVVQAAVQLPDDADEWLNDYRGAKDAVEKAQARLDSIKNYFRMWTGDAGAGYIGDRKVVSYPEVRKTGIDVTKLKEEYPEIAAKVTKTSHYRSMTIRAPK